MGSGAETQGAPPAEEPKTLDKVENAAGAGMEKVGGAVTGTFDSIDDKMDQEVAIGGIKMPFVTLLMGILVIVGILLPWIAYQSIDITTGTITTEYYLGVEFTYALIIMVMAILMLVFAAIKKPVISAVFSIIAFVLTLLPLLLVASFTDVTGGIFKVLGIGYWLTLIGSLLGFIFGILKK